MATELKGNDLLKVIEELLSRPREPEEDLEGITSWQLAREMGLDRSSVQERLRVLVEKGILGVRMGRRLNIMHVARRTPLYYLVEEKRAE